MPATKKTDLPSAQGRVSARTVSPVSKVTATKTATSGVSAKESVSSESSAVTSSRSPRKKSNAVSFDLPSLQDLLEAGSHFGHKVSRWNPKMEPYIFDTRNAMHIIDLTKTLGLLGDAVSFLQTVAIKGNVLLVGTKGQAATIIKNAGVDHGAYYISRRWPGGLLTNFKVVRKSVLRLIEIEENLASGKGYETKRERLVLERDCERLMRLYEGIRFMEKPPSAIIVIDSRVEKNALKEARRTGVPVVAMLDTNCDPTLVDYPIPANDDAIRSIELFVNVLVQGFSNAQTSADLIQKRNDYHSRLEQMRKQTQAEEERLRKDREIEIQRLKAMKEGKTVPGLTTDMGKVVRIVHKKDAQAEVVNSVKSNTIGSEGQSSSADTSAIGTKTVRISAAAAVTAKRSSAKKGVQKKISVAKSASISKPAAKKRSVPKKTVAKKTPTLFSLKLPSFLTRFSSPSILTYPPIGNSLTIYSTPPRVNDHTFGPIPIENSKTTIPVARAAIKCPNSWTRTTAPMIIIKRISVVARDIIEILINLRYKKL